LDFHHKGVSKQYNSFSCHFLRLAKEKALAMRDEKPVLDPGRCILCGDCLHCCPMDAWKTEQKGYSVFAGGMMGRHPRLGEKIADFVDEEQGMRIVQRCVDFYRLQGNRRERFGDLIRRVSMDEFKAAVLQEQ